MPLAVGIALLGALALGYIVLTLAGGSHGWGIDYLAYHEAALRIAANGTPYQPATLDGPFFPGPSGLYLYSPVLALVLVPLATLGSQTAILGWLGLQLTALALACALMPVARAIRLATLGIACLSWPILFDIKLGNVSMLITLLAVIAWRWLDRPPASIAVALSLFIRPQLALVVASWALRKRWRAIGWVAVATLAIFVATLMFIPIDVWFDYGRVLRNMSDFGSALGLSHFTVSIVSLGGPEWLARLALPLGYLIAVLATFLSVRRDAELSLIVSFSATLLISPLLWPFYLAQLLLPAAFLASRGHVWALGLPLLGWLPEPLLPFVAVAGVLLPFLAPELPAGREEPEPSGRSTGELNASLAG